jgi:hypothetical protein
VITAPVVPPVTRDGAREAARNELSKDVYHRYDDPWPVRLFDWVTHQIGQLLDRVAERSPGGGAGALLLVALVVALLLLARWRLGPVRRDRRYADALLPDRSTSAQDHRSEAAAAVAAGRWADAVLARMRAIARDLEERGVLDERAGRTADELAREVETLLPSVAEPVRSAVAVFDEVLYGGHPATAALYDVVARADDAVRGARRGAVLA